LVQIVPKRQLEERMVAIGTRQAIATAKKVQ
jgi:hypothetical protein